MGFSTLVWGFTQKPGTSSTEGTYHENRRTSLVWTLTGAGKDQWS